MTIINALLAMALILIAKVPAYGQTNVVTEEAAGKILNAVLDASGLDESKKMFVIKDPKKNSTQYLKYDAIKTDLQQVKNSVVGSVAIQISDSKFSIHDKIPGCNVFLRGRLAFQVLLGMTSAGTPSVKVPKERFNDNQLEVRTQNCGVMSFMVKGMVPSSLQETIQEAVTKVMKSKKIGL